MNVKVNHCVFCDANGNVYCGKQARATKEQFGYHRNNKHSHAGSTVIRQKPMQRSCRMRAVGSIVWTMGVLT